MLTEFALPSGDLALLDAVDLPLMRRFSWYATPGPNITYVKSDAGYLHRLLLNAPSGLDVDHVNRTRNGLDNRRANLRLATRAENLANSFNPKVNTSGYKGVSWIKAEQKWVAGIKIDGRRRTLGRFRDPWEAAQAYNEAARAAWGEFAYQNRKKQGG